MNFHNEQAQNSACKCEQVIDFVYKLHDYKLNFFCNLPQLTLILVFNVNYGL